MKKLYTLCLLLAISAGAFAQNARMIQHSGNNHAANQIGNVHTQALGDTLLYIPFLNIFVNPTDQTNFTYATEDLDGFTTNSTYMWPTADYAYFYSLNAWDYHPWETPGVDTSFFAAATSWFDNDPALSDDWMEFGPITIPAGGATLSWFVKTNPSYRDGYEVLTSTTGMSNYTDFSSTPVYSRADLFPSTQTATDTIWQPVSVTIPGPGLKYFAFHHNANGMDVLYLDEILLTEGPAGVKENATADFSMFPNPAKGMVQVNINSDSKEHNIVITDMIGNVVSDKMYTSNTANVDLSGIASGMYLLSIKDNGMISTKKLVIQ
jgi:hypothetical protein